jgi:hypothetical protein
MSFIDISDDSLYNIFTFLQESKTVLNLLFVSKYFNSLINKERIFSFIKNVKFKIKEKPKRKIYYVNKLIITKAFHPNNKIIKFYFPNLNKIYDKLPKPIKKYEDGDMRCFCKRCCKNITCDHLHCWVWSICDICKKKIWFNCHRKYGCTLYAWRLPALICFNCRIPYYEKGFSTGDIYKLKKCYS